MILRRADRLQKGDEVDLPFSATSRPKRTRIESIKINGTCVIITYDYSTCGMYSGGADWKETAHYLSDDLVAVYNWPIELDHTAVRKYD